VKYLAEIAEEDAEGAVAELYEDIRRVLGLPLVNLVYRHLAAEGRLEEVWRGLRPSLVHPAIDAAADELMTTAAGVEVAELSRAALAAAGVGEDELAGAVATVDAYNHANPRNLIAIRALLEPSEGNMNGGQAQGHVSPRPVPRRLLPMADLRRLEPPVLALLEEMAQPFAARRETVLVPGLFRHFAGNSALLALLWTVLRPHVAGRRLARRANLVDRGARALAATLPAPVHPVEEPESRQVLERFAFTLPRMVVAGSVLRRALG
jgi:hypothetical protein